ncbi:conserved hypothetical protein [Uncinocarpus reesii 1704]|uniref:protein disulfide-isomerase n=1 Tax=Uncinocarpus reesii (strain UAMH 1704) TaxID=336963 RepID=C4JVV2_UNCRE|nr:uncharacterized protein UREG_06694 [Uncinocarpus reesii 1704]EEP81829.1 conserved hypothetical protein [Uncinocarpus reesii 1704]
MSPFYAPWCGHCQNLKPAYEKAARSLEGLAKVAAMNCDDEANKHLCSVMRIQGFPTLRIVVPSDKPGKPKHEDYQGARTAKGIVDAVVEKIPNHVKRLTDKDIDGWLANSNETAKALLFTEKGTTSALLRALAIDYLGKIHIGQIRNKETSAVDTFGITKFPTLVLLPGSDKPSMVYDGELKKKPIVEFLKQVAEPNQDPPESAAPKAKTAKLKKPEKSTTAGTTSTSTTKAAASSDTPKASDGTENLKEPKIYKGSKARSKPQQTGPDLRMLSTSTDLKTTCLSSKTGTCVLAIVHVPSDPNGLPSTHTLEALGSLAEIEHKHTLRQGRLFPFYVLPDFIDEVPTIQTALGLETGGVEIIAINGKRGWWRRYDPSDGKNYGVVDIESWIDQVRMGEGERRKLPDGIIPSDGQKTSKQKPKEKPKEEPATPPQNEPDPEPEQEPEATPSATPEMESQKESKTVVHEEL